MIFWYEWKKEWKDLSLWMLITVILLCLSLIGFIAASGFFVPGGSLEGYEPIQVFYYTIQCWILLLCVGIYSAISGGLLLMREELNQSAEFFYSRPITRGKIFWEKAAALLLRIVLLVLLVTVGVAVEFLFWGVQVPWGLHLLFQGMFFLACVNVAAWGMLFSSMLSHGGITFGGMIILLFSVLLLAGKTVPVLSFFRYLTPFAVCDGALYEGYPDLVSLGIGTLCCVILLFAARWRFGKKKIFLGDPS